VVAAPRAPFGLPVEVRLVAATTDPATLPAASTWYVVTNIATTPDNDVSFCSLYRAK